MDNQNMLQDQAGYYDLRGAIRSILNYKWYIILSSVICAVVAVIASVFIISPQYQASTYLIVSEPTLSADFDKSIVYDLYVPESRDLSSFALMDGLINLVLDEFNQDPPVLKEKLDLEVIVNGSNQLELVVKDSDPMFAADFANKWAEVLVKQINDLHGVDDETILIMEKDAEVFAVRMEDAQAKLEIFLAESQIDALIVSLENSKHSLANLEHEVNFNQSKIRNAQAILQQMTELEGSAVLPSGLRLSLLSLQQPATYNAVDFDLQILDTDLTTLQVSEAISLTGGLITSLENQNLDLEELILDQESEVAELSTLYEEENYHLSLLIGERDMARSVYYSLLNQIEEMKISNLQVDGIARVAIPADLPTKEIGPQLINNTIIAGLFGLVLSLVVVTVIIWWNTNE